MQLAPHHLDDAAAHLASVLSLARSLTARSKAGDAPFPTEAELLARELLSYACRLGSHEAEAELRQMNLQRHHVDPSDLDWV